MVFAVAVAGAPNRPIRLRNELISPAAPLRGPHASQQPDDGLVFSGLLLLQFVDHLQPAWRAELQAKGVALLRYVPEDAFVAHAENARLGDLKRLPFVRWAGDYRPDHKLHSQLAGPPGRQRADEELFVSVLLSPRAGPAEIAQARRFFRAVQVPAQLRAGTILRGRITRGQLRQLAEWPAALWIEPGPNIKLFDEIASKIVAGDGGTRTTLMQSLGFDGAGVTVAVADSGLHTGEAATMHPDLFGRVTAFFYYGDLDGAEDGHSHGTHVTGIIAGNGATGETDEIGALYGLGVAPGASIVAQRIFDGAGNYTYPEASFEPLTRDAVQAGAEIGSNSWGDDTAGRYDLSAMEFDALVRDADALTDGDQPYIVEFSAGNAGPGQQTVGSPAVAKNVIATGASQNDRFDFFIYAEGQETLADFSSRGPTEDGRIKPDVVAPGTWIASLRSPLGDDNNAWADISENYLYQGGTSQAGPHVSGAAAVFVQWYRQTVTNQTPSPALVKAALIHSAVDLDDGETTTEPVPNFDEGWGRVDLAQIIGSPRVHEFTDQSVRLSIGETWEKAVVVADPTEPLNVTLAYTDAPGFPGAVGALVNDLDLEVVAPDGRVYRGNQFAGGDSVPDAPAADSVNNVEGVYLSAPPPGEYVIRIRAANVPEDALAATPAIDQDFALVVSATLQPPGFGIVFFDRPAYRAPGRIHLKVIDRDLAGRPSVTATLQSTTEPAGLTLTLLASGPDGAFTGSVATATGPAANDGLLQIADGDLITATYLDDGTPRTATARGDFRPPIISNVTVTNEFGVTVVSWRTDEPADALVRFSTDASFNRSATNTFLTFDHRVELSGLIAGQTYRLVVISTDAAGNTVTNDNGGGGFVFVAPPTATVLLVDAYRHTPDDEGPFIPLSAYTNAMTQVGVSFDVWNVEQRGTPTNLRPYRIVVWRLNDSFYNMDSLTAAQQAAISNYLSGGGSFFLASAEIISRMLNANQGRFLTNVLHLGGFERNPDIFGCPCGTCDEDHGVPHIESHGSDPISLGVDVDLNYANYPELDIFFCVVGPDVADTFTPATNAAPIFAESASGRPCGLKFPPTGQDATGRIVFLSFPLDAVPETGSAPNTRAALLRNIFQFLAPGLGGFGTIALDREEYTTPALVTVEVADEDLIGQAATTVNFSSSSFPNAVPVTLEATTTPGVFRGVLTLVPGTDPPGAARLRANEGDTIYARYLDASGGVTIEATATVDTQPPVIANVAFTPDYEEAIITWETLEPADALVQFGESTFLGRTAYDPEFDFVHELRLTGLVPDRVYYFRAVSRDPAGNFTTNAMQTFRTLRPFPVPFVDHFAAPSADWFVFSSEGSQSEWTLGVPDNGVETNAVSPPFAWGSSLNGAVCDFIDTLLVSPAIQLTGGNTAALRFWHAYDFQDRTGIDLWEFGALYALTNNDGPEVLLASFADVSGGWVDEEIDLSPYLGHVVRLVWHHQLFSGDVAARPGWLLDDVEVTVTDVPPGTIVIANNLWQARYTLNGPLNRAGQGALILTNAPPGEYRVNFGRVPFYNPPPAQTNEVVSGQTIVFRGDYTFTDSNANGMSDAWEQNHFGEVSPGRTRATDTDGDGMTDYDEFMAGTSPTSSASMLTVLAPVMQPEGSVRLFWVSVPSRGYRVLGSVDAVNWMPVSDWILATSQLTTFALPAPSPGAPFLFRVEVRP
jgi:hypothetical protein